LQPRTNQQRAVRRAAIFCKNIFILAFEILKIAFFCILFYRVLVVFFFLFSNRLQAWKIAISPSIVEKELFVKFLFAGTYHNDETFLSLKKKHSVSSNTFATLRISAGRHHKTNEIEETLKAETNVFAESVREQVQVGHREKM